MWPRTRRRSPTSPIPNWPRSNCQNAHPRDQPPGICGNLRLFHGQNPGEVTGRCDPAEGNIRTYEAQWTLDPNGTTWGEVTTFPNSRAFRFTGLTRGKDIWMRVRARNAIGAGPWSDPATIMVI